MLRILACSILVAVATPSALADDALLSFDEALARALTANSQLLAQEYRTERAGIEYEAARAQLQPSFNSFVNSDARSGSDVGSQYGIGMEQPMSSGGSFGIGYYDNSFGGESLSELRLSYTLPFFGSEGEDLRRSIDDASFAAGQENARLRLTRLEVEREVLRRYYDVVLAGTNVELAASAEQIAGEGAEAIRIRRNGGQASDLQVRRADMAAAQARVRSRQAERALEVAKDQLRLSIGAAPDEAIAVDPAPPPGLDIGLVDSPVDELLAFAEQERLEVIEAGRALTAAERRMTSAESQWMPDVAVSLQYALIDETSPFGQSFDDQRFGIGVRMSTGFRRRDAERSEARHYLDVRERERAYSFVKQNVAMDVKRAHAQVGDLLSQLDLARISLALAGEELERAEIMAERGAVDRLELLQFELARNEAEHQIRSLEIAHTAALYDLQLAAGGSLQ